MPNNYSSASYFCTLAFSPINHHMKRFFGFDALRLNICQKAFCEIQLSMGQPNTVQPQIEIPIVIIFRDSNYYYFTQVHVYSKHLAHMP